MAGSHAQSEQEIDNLESLKADLMSVFTNGSALSKAARDRLVDTKLKLGKV